MEMSAKFGLARQPGGFGNSAGELLKRVRFDTIEAASHDAKTTEENTVEIDWEKLCPEDEAPAAKRRLQGLGRLAILS